MSAENNSLKTQLRYVLQFFDGIVYVGPWDDAHADQAFWVCGAIFLAQPVVIGANHGFVDIVVGDVTPQGWPRHLCGEQHLAVKTVLVLLSYPLLRRTYTRCALDSQSEGLPLAGCPSGAKVQEIGLAQGLSFNQQSVPAIWECNGAGSAVPVFFRHSVDPPFRWHFQVTVAGHQSVIPSHDILPLPYKWLFSKQV